MADCDIPTISLPEITCLADLREWGVQAEAVIQAAVDHIVGCIQDFEIPQLDICVSKDDLVECPLDCDMINFEGATYGETGGPCRLPNPPNLGDLEFRWGKEQSACVSTGWVLDNVVFDTPFDTECHYVGITLNRAYDSDCHTEPGSAEQIMKVYAPMVRGISATGFSVYFIGAESLASRKLTYFYFALGH